MISDIPGGGSVTGQVANCVAMGTDGKFFLIGASLYTHGNVWGIANPPEDWNLAAKSDPASHNPATTQSSRPAEPKSPQAQKKVWPYNLFSEGGEASLGRK